MTFNTALEVRQVLMELANSGAWRVYEGPHLERLREELCDQFERKLVRLCCSGTVGIELAIRSLKLPANSEVLVAGYDYPGNFRAVEDAGASVGLVDVASGGWVTNQECLEASLGPNSRAIIVSHLHGTMVDMESVCDWAHRRGLFVVEDVCQEPGAMVATSVGLKPAGSFGDLSVVSFGGSKLLSAGRGGAVLTNDPQFAQRMTVFCERGNDAFALSELQAALVRPQVKNLHEDSAARRRAASLVTLELRKYPWLSPPIDSGAGSLPSYYKLALMLQWPDPAMASHPVFASTQMDSSNGSAKRFRDWVIENLAGVQVGPGFRGFAGRSNNRCRKPSSLANSLVASVSTVVLHHAHLLCPETGESTVNDVLTAFQSLHEKMTRMH